MALTTHLQRNQQVEEHLLSPNMYQNFQIPKEVERSFSRKDMKHFHRIHLNFGLKMLRTLLH